MALKDIKIEDLLTAVGFNPEDAETVSLDDIKTHVDTKYVLRDNVLKDEEIKKKITGKVLGSITTKAANIFGLKSSDVDGKQLEDVMLLGKTAYETKLTELEQQAGKGNDKKVEELSKTLAQKEAELKLSQDGLKQWEEKYNAETGQWETKLKSYKLNDKVSKVKETLKDKFVDDYFKDTLKKTRFEALIHSKYEFDIDEKDNPIVKSKADGSIVKSKKTVGHAATLDEIFLSEMEAANILKKNNAKQEKVITFANNSGGEVKSNVHPNAQKRINEIAKP